MFLISNGLYLILYNSRFFKTLHNILYNHKKEDSI